MGSVSAVAIAVEAEPAVEAAEGNAEESEPDVELLWSLSRLIPACLASIDADDRASNRYGGRSIGMDEVFAAAAGAYA